MLLSKTFNQPEPVFQSVVGPRSKPPPAGAVDNNQPFFKPQTDQPTTTQQEPTGSPATVHQQPAHRPKTDNQPRSSDQPLQLTNLPATHSQQPTHRPKSDNRPATVSTHQPLTNQLDTHHQQPSHRPKTDNRPSASFTHQQLTSQPATLHQQLSDRPKPDNNGFDTSTSPVQVQQSPETDTDTDEGQVSDQEQDTSVTDTDHASTEEQNYRQTMGGVRSYMGQNHIPDIDNQKLSVEDNPFATPKQQPVGKVSVNLTTDDWLCRKMDDLNLTLTQGNPSRSSETGDLQRDHLVKHSKSCTKWATPQPGQPSRFCIILALWLCKT